MKTAQINKINKSIMGTTKFDMKAATMRKPQNFIVYPKEKGGDVEVLRVQSSRYWAEINTATGTGELSTGKDRATSWSFKLDQIDGKTKEFKLSAEDLEALKDHIRGTASAAAGSSVVTTDNSDAHRIV